MNHKEWLARSKDRSRRKHEAVSRTVLTVTLTGAELEEFTYAVLLNRRMLDRGLDNVIVDKKLSPLLQKLWAAFDETDEGRALAEEAAEALRQLKQDEGKE